MNCLLRRRDTNLSVMSWTRHLLNWLGINFSLPPMAIKNLLALHQTLIDTLSLSAVIWWSTTTKLQCNIFLSSTWWFKIKHLFFFLFFYLLLVRVEKTNFWKINTKQKENKKIYIYLYEYQSNQQPEKRKCPPDQNFFFHLPLNLDQNFVGLLVDITLPIHFFESL